MSDDIRNEGIPEELLLTDEDWEAFEREEREREYLDHAHKKAALGIAVVGLTALIGALWVTILPVQLGDTAGLGLKDAARWQAVDPQRPEDGPPPATFMEALAGIRSNLDRIEEEELRAGRGGTETGARIEELRAKIENASARGEADASAEADAAEPTP